MNIDELHDKLFDFLCVIDDICRKNNLKYFICGGAELGSVREKDFIAWDDDIDLKIMAEDWPEFFRVMQRELPPHYHIALPEDFSPAFYDFITRIYDDRVLLRKSTPEDEYYGNKQNCLGCDLFLLFKVPENKFRARMFDFRNRMIYGYGLNHRYPDRTAEYSFVEKCEISVLKALGKRLTAEEVCRKWFRHVNRYSSLKDHYMRYPAAWALDDIRFLKEEFYKTTAYGEIRGRKFPVPGMYDEELTVMYGDWRTPRQDTKENGKPFIRHLEEE